MKLKDLRARTFELNRQEERLAELRSAAERTTTMLTGVKVKSSRDTSMLENITLKILELERACEEAKAALLVDRLSASVELAERLKDRDEYRVLKLRYLDGRSWAEIAQEFERTISRIMQLHKQGLRHLEQAGRDYKEG